MRTAGLSSAVSRPFETARSQRDRVCILAVLAILATSWITSSSASSADLMAVLAAALAYSEGATHLVYPGDQVVFGMMPPDEWSAMMRGAGYDGELYPYLYPPLWAALFSLCAQAIDVDWLVDVARVANHALLLGSLWLAWRITGRVIPFFVFMAIGAAATFLTLPGAVALAENQPQILVGALILLAIERSGAGAPRTAGAALALAAALKGYPALLAVIWIGTREWRALAAFAAAGAALAMLSVMLAGWPLHAEFLRVLSVISDTALATNFSFGLNPLLAQIPPIYPNEIVMRPDLVNEAGEAAQYLAVVKTELWKSASLALLIVSLLAVTFAMGRADHEVRYSTLWPFSITIIALFLPLPWCYSCTGPQF